MEKKNSEVPVPPAVTRMSELWLRGNWYYEILLASKHRQNINTRFRECTYTRQIELSGHKFRGRACKMSQMIQKWVNIA
jgi:hypothetical protein